MALSATQQRIKDSQTKQLLAKQEKKPSVKLPAKATVTPKLSTTVTKSGSLAAPKTTPTVIKPDPKAQANQPIGKPLTAVNPVTGTNYSGKQQEILAKQMGQQAPATPKVAAETAPPVASKSEAVGSAPTEDSVAGEAEQVLAQAETDKKEIDAIKDLQLDAEEDNKQALLEATANAYETEQRNLDRMEQLNKEILDSRNAALQMGAEVERKDAETAYQRSKVELDLQRERTQKAYQDQIIEQKAENLKRQLGKESFLAVAGGYGSLTANKQMEDTMVENDKLLNNLVFQKDIGDRETTAQIDDVSRSYGDNLFRIESKKQQAVNENYSQYLEYVTELQNNREMSEDQKYERIKEAQVQYKQNIAAISQGAFEQKYNVMQTASEQARSIIQTQKDDSRLVMKDVLSAYIRSDSVALTPAEEKALNDLERRAGYPVGTASAMLRGLKEQAQAENLLIQEVINDDGDVTYVAVDKSTGEIKNYETLKGLSKVSPTKYQVQFNPVTGDQVIFDPTTGQIISGPGGGGYSSSGGVSAPPGSQLIGDIAVSDEAFDKTFNIGGVGGWCGVWASTISTASAVGNTWGEKISKVDKQDNPSPGDKIVIPLGVRTDSDWGHVAVVTNYDPATGIISVVESNKNGEKNTGSGPGHITAGTYDINQLVSQYGDNFGFVSGGFRSNIQSKLQQGSVSMQQPSYSGGQTGAGGITQSAALAEAASRGLSGKEAYAFAASAVKTGAYPRDLDEEQRDREDWDRERDDQRYESDKDREENQRNFERADKLRDEFNGRQIVKDFIEVKDKARDIKGILESGVGGPGDLALVFQFMKALDPNSVVREAEYDAAASSGNIFKGVYAKYNGYMSEQGGFLPPEVRKSFYKLTQNSLNTKLIAFRGERDRYYKLADKAEVDRDYIVEDYSLGTENLFNESSPEPSSGGGFWNDVGNALNQ